MMGRILSVRSHTLTGGKFLTSWGIRLRRDANEQRVHLEKQTTWDYTKSSPTHPLHRLQGPRRGAEGEREEDHLPLFRSTTALATESKTDMLVHEVSDRDVLSTKPLVACKAFPSAGREFGDGNRVGDLGAAWNEGTLLVLLISTSREILIFAMYRIIVNGQTLTAKMAAFSGAPAVTGLSNSTLVWW